MSGNGVTKSEHKVKKAKEQKPKRIIATTKEQESPGAGKQEDEEKVYAVEHIQCMDGSIVDEHERVCEWAVSRTDGSFTPGWTQDMGFLDHRPSEDEPGMFEAGPGRWYQLGFYVGDKMCCKSFKAMPGDFRRLPLEEFEKIFAVPTVKSANKR